MLKIRPFFVCFLGLIAATASAFGAQETVLGSEGEIYLVKTGTYGELFPGGNDTEPAYHVLALEVLKPGSALERHLVPGTEGPDLEGAPSLIFEEISKTLLLVWERRRNVIHPILMLSGYRGTWLEPKEIVGSPFSPKASPQIAITRDTYKDGGADRHRTVLHVVWAEESGNDLIEAFYTPVLLEDGAFAENSPVINLNELDDSSPEANAAEPTPELLRALRIQNGRDERTVVVAFASQASHRVNVLEIDSLPADLSLLADGARAQIIEIGLKNRPNRSAFASQIRGRILEIGKAFHPEVLQGIADHVYSTISKSDESADIKVIADGARAQIIEIGAKLSGRGLRNSTALSSSDIREIPADPTAPPTESGLPSYLIQLRLTASRPVPITGTNQLRQFFSPDGTHSLLAWVDGNRVLYRESSGADWKETLEIKLSPSLDLGQAFQILEQRIRNR